MEEQILANQPEQTIPASLPADNRWPKSVRVLAVLVLIVSCLSVTWSIYSSIAVGFSPWIVLPMKLIGLVPSILALILFSKPTRQTPWVTALPRTVSFILSLASTFYSLAATGRFDPSIGVIGGADTPTAWALFSYAVPRVLMLVTLVLYWVIVLLRPRSKTLAVIYSALALYAYARSAVLSLSLLSEMHRHGDVPLASVMTVVFIVLVLPATLLYIVAAFRVPPLKSADAQ